MNTPFRKYKRWNANGGLGSPFIAFWPGSIEGGRVERQPINILDIMPTLLDVADVDYPENLRPLDRKIIFSAFIEQPAEKPDPMYFQLKYAEAVDQKAIVQWPWKGWYNGEEGWSLYRLDRDWAETVDLKKDCPDQLRTMVEAYEQFDAAAQRDQQRYGSEFLPHKRINK